MQKNVLVEGKGRSYINVCGGEGRTYINLLVEGEVGESKTWWRGGAYKNKSSWWSGEEKLYKYVRGGEEMR